MISPPSNPDAPAAHTASTGADASIAALERTFDELAAHFGDERIARLRFGTAHRMRGIAVVLDALYDPGNRSSIYRTAEGLGLLDVHLVRPEAAWKEHARSVSRGAEKWLTLHHWRSAADCATAIRARGMQILCADASVTNDLTPFDLRHPTALVFGNEHEGVSPAMRAAADGFFAIPMRGFAGSFNVGVAAGLALHAARVARERALGSTTDLDALARMTLLVDYATRSSLWMRRLEDERRARGAADGATPPPAPDA
jgi:tRNA (guanosine-2'-O-)-methyltransferase